LYFVGINSNIFVNRDIIQRKDSDCPWKVTSGWFHAWRKRKQFIERW